MGQVRGLLWLGFLLPSSFGSLRPALSSVQSLSRVCDPTDCSTPGFPDITNSRSLLKLMSVESVMPSNHLILLSSPSPSFNLSQHHS